jgi:hypothetical protein
LAIRSIAHSRLEPTELLVQPIREEIARESFIYQEILQRGIERGIE